MPFGFLCHGVRIVSRPAWVLVTPVARGGLSTRWLLDNQKLLHLTTDSGTASVFLQLIPNQEI